MMTEESNDDLELKRWIEMMSYRIWWTLYLVLEWKMKMKDSLYINSYPHTHKYTHKNTTKWKHFCDIKHRLYMLVPFPFCTPYSTKTSNTKVSCIKLDAHQKGTVSHKALGNGTGKTGKMSTRAIPYFIFTTHFSVPSELTEPDYHRFRRSKVLWRSSSC